MTTIVNTAGTTWPCEADQPGRREAVHAKMQLLANYLDQIGLTRVPLDVDYDTDGDETEIPLYTDNDSVGKSAWMRFDWDGHPTRAPIVLYFRVSLDKYFNTYSSRKRARYLIEVVVRTAANDADPYDGPNRIFGPRPLTFSSNSTDYNVFEAGSVGDFFMLTDRRLFIAFCADSINLVNTSTGLRPRSALMLYIERADDYDVVVLQDSPYFGVSISSSTAVFGALGEMVSSTIPEMFLANLIGNRAGKAVVQSVCYRNGVEYLEMSGAFVAATSMFPPWRFYRLDFDGAEKLYLSFASMAFLPGNRDDHVLLIEWEAA